MLSTICQSILTKEESCWGKEKINLIPTSSVVSPPHQDDETEM